MQKDRESYRSSLEHRSLTQAFLDGCRSLTHGFSVILAIDPPKSKPPMSIEEMNRRDFEDMQKDWQQTGDDLRDTLNEMGIKEK